MTPGAQAESDAELLDAARNISQTIYHPTSTVRMGADGDAVVDPELRVYGVAGLRVVDVAITTDARQGGETCVNVVWDGLALLRDITKFRLGIK